MPNTPHSDTSRSGDPLARAGLLAEFVDAVAVADTHLQRSDSGCPDVAAARDAIARAVALARAEPPKGRLNSCDDVDAGNNCGGTVARYSTPDSTDTLGLCRTHAAQRGLNPHRDALRSRDPRA